MLKGKQVREKLEKENQNKPKTKWIPFIPLGPPKKYKNAKELNVVVKQYFMQCRKHDTVPTIGGLANRLGISRRTLLKYEKDEKKYPGYSKVLEKARELICTFNEQLIYYKDFYQAAKFTLENNFEGFDAQQRSKNENININTSYEEYLKKVEDKDEY